MTWNHDIIQCKRVFNGTYDTVSYNPSISVLIVMVKRLNRKYNSCKTLLFQLFIRFVSIGITRIS